jgi:hypothetical protein
LKKSFEKPKKYYFCRPKSTIQLPDGVTGNTSDFGSEESRFEPWSGNLLKGKPTVKQCFNGGFFVEGNKRFLPPLSKLQSPGESPATDPESFIFWVSLASTHRVTCLFHWNFTQTRRKVSTGRKIAKIYVGRFPHGITVFSCSFLPAMRNALNVYLCKNNHHESQRKCKIKS